MNIITHATKENQDITELAKPVIDPNSESFLPTVVLWSAYKIRQQGPIDNPAQVIASIHRMVCDERITLDTAMAFTATLPKIKPSQQRVLTSWWDNMQKGDLCAKTFTAPID